MSFNLNFHREHNPIDFAEILPYEVEHTDYDAATSPTRVAYTVAKIGSGPSSVCLYLEYGERIVLKSAGSLKNADLSEVMS